jgi:hypothetical protein
LHCTPCIFHWYFLNFVAICGALWLYFFWLVSQSTWKWLLVWRSLLLIQSYCKVGNKLHLTFINMGMFPSCNNFNGHVYIFGTMLANLAYICLCVDYKVVYAIIFWYLAQIQDVNWTLKLDVAMCPSVNILLLRFRQEVEFQDDNNYNVVDLAMALAYVHSFIMQMMHFPWFNFVFAS